MAVGYAAAVHEHDVVIVGAGIAGVSLAYFLAEAGVTDVVLLEREDRLAVHASGRSAATLSRLDANPTLCRLKVLGAPFLAAPPAGFAEHRLLDPIGVVAVFGAATWPAVRETVPALAAIGLEVRVLDPDEAIARVPVLERTAVAGALEVPGDGRIDVHELLSSYLRHARQRGVACRFGVEATRLVVEDRRCRGVETPAGEFRARLVVDAGGAWAGALGRAAGATPIPLQPKRRTLVVFDAPPDLPVAGWPLVHCDEQQLYFLPEGAGVMLSPMDEVDMAPCDPRPSDETIAAAFERLRQVAPRLVPRTVRRRWAGLRTFAPDRVLVVGEDPQLPGFFWLAGQGGCGIETSPIVGQVAADLIVRGWTERFDAALLSPARFAAS